MERRGTFTTGALVGIAATTLVHFTFSKFSPGAQPLTAQPQPVATSALPAREESKQPHAAGPAAEETELEQSPRELRANGFAIVPQEFAVFCSPLFETDRHGDLVFGEHLRELLQLDEREIRAVGAAPKQLSDQLDTETSRRLVITDAAEFVLTARVPAFPDARNALIAAARSQILRELDADSGALFAHLRLNETLAPQPIGTVESSLHVRRPPDDDFYHVTVRIGDNYSNLMRLTGDELIRRYPQLSARPPSAERPPAP